MPKHNRMLNKRFVRVGCVGLFLVVSGVLYGLFVEKTHLGIPCLFHQITGLKCPGCGITRMAVALLHLDIEGAFEANPAILILSPVFLVVFITYIISYVKTGEWKMGRLQNGAVWFCIVVLLLYGIGRNLKSLSI